MGGREGAGGCRGARRGAVLTTPAAQDSSKNDMIRSRIRAAMQGDRVDVSLLDKELGGWRRGFECGGV